MMKTKIMVICIFLVIMLIIPISSAVDVNTNGDNESRENPEIEPLNSYSEIITFIDGSCYDAIIYGKNGLIYDVEFVAGLKGTWFEIYGWRHPFPTVFSEINVMYIRAPRFIGFIRDWGGAYAVWGIALGDIEWHK